MITCPACGAANREGARFCDTCAAPLTAAPPPREQRKTVTVLQCDVTGSTALGERLDPESLRAALARYFEISKAVIERHGGTVEKFIGYGKSRYVAEAARSVASFARVRSIAGTMPFCS